MGVGGHGITKGVAPARLELANVQSILFGLKKKKVLESKKLVFNTHGDSGPNQSSLGHSLQVSI